MTHESQNTCSHRKPPPHYFTPKSTRKPTPPGPRTPAGGVNHLYQNTGGGTFSKVTDAGPITSDSADSTSAAWGDYDGDGDLDLFVANYGISRTQQHHAHAHEHANIPHSLCCPLLDLLSASFLATVRPLPVVNHPETLT